MRFLTVAFCALLLAVPATAGKGGRHKINDSITVTTTGNQATFTVHLDAPLGTNAYGNNLAYSLWVSNVCEDADGVVVSAEYHPVVWNPETDAPVDGTAGPYLTAGAQCVGAVVLFPDVWTAIDSVTYLP